MATSPSSTVSDTEVLCQFLDRQINGVVDGYLRDLAVQQQQNCLSAHKLDTLLNAVQSIGQRMDALDKQLATLQPVPSQVPVKALSDMDSTAPPAKALVPAAPAAPVVKRRAQPGDILCAGSGFPELVLLPGGSFQMGSTQGSDEQPVHTVNVASFALGKYPVTQGQWKKVMGSNPSHSSSGGDQCPVERVSWDDAQAFIQKLNQQTGHTYRLPSEAEWEYACRAGSISQWCFGDDESQLKHYAWDKGNSGGETHPVGEKKPNAFGLYDMHGNVWEWCEDKWHGNYQGAPSDGRAWVDVGAVERVLRGGSWNSVAGVVRSANRDYYVPDYRNSSIGFRVSRTAP